MNRRLVVVSAGLREPSSTTLLGQRLATAVEAALDERGVQCVTHVIEVRSLGAEIVQALTSFPPAALQEALDLVGSADGLIALTPLMNTSYSGLFKAFFDVVPENALQGMPVLLGATGGTPRHSLALDYALRPMFAYLHAEALTTTVFAATADWGAQEDGVRPLPERIRRAGSALAEAMVRHEPRSQDEFGAVPSFEEMFPAGS